MSTTNPDQVTIYTTPFCGYCTSAKRLLERLGISYQEIDVSLDHSLRRRISAENDGYRTVPMIYVEGRFIGGYDELFALERKGALRQLRRAS